ncbi:hypothetical protein JG688_00018501 [Phytophthora aleatoria]|uniref:Uncharacterized protein n=1 Tax=Phytophthora aleatoria TaxID=2496075 RepID=A0A8J5M0L0_9STRA|nr:hypothetical protein JG688_00018501 [Phytophthora aleatoria]
MSVTIGNRLAYDVFGDVDALFMNLAADASDPAENAESLSVQNGRVPNDISAELRVTENRIEAAKHELIAAEEKRADVLRLELAHYPDVCRGRRTRSQEGCPEYGWEAVQTEDGWVLGTESGINPKMSPGMPDRDMDTPGVAYMM